MDGPYNSINLPENQSESSRSDLMQSNIVKDKIQYILENTLQRETYKQLVSVQEKVAFFKEHFILRDHESKHLLSYFDCKQPEDFVDQVQKMILEIENETA